MLFFIFLAESQDKTTPKPTSQATEPPDNIIRCEFENDFCHWNIQADENYKWERFSSETLNNVSGT